MTPESTDSARGSSGRAGPGTGGAKRSQGRPVLLAVVGVLAVLVGGFVAYIVVREPEPVSGFVEADGRALFRGLDTRIEEARRVAIRSPAGAVTLERDERRWRVAENDGYPAREGAVEAFLRKMSDLRAVYVSDSESPDYAEYGVTEPGGPGAASVRVRVLDADGEPLARAILGHGFSAPGGRQIRKVFVRAGDDARVWLADGAFPVPARPGDWIGRRLRDVPGDRVARVTLSGAGTPRIVMERADDGSFRLAEGLPDDAELTGPWVFETLSALLSGVTFEGMQRAGSLPDAFAPGRQAVIETTDGVTYTVRLMTEDGEPLGAGATVAGQDTWAVFSASIDEETASEAARERAASFNERHGEWTYRLSLEKLEAFALRPEDVSR